MTISKSDAKKLAKKLVGEGKKYAEVSEALAAKGYVGSKSGAPLSISMVSSLVRSPSRQDKVRSKATKLTPKQLRSRLDALRTILYIDSMDASEKVALAQLVMEHGSINHG